MILVDSNVLMYAAGADHPRKRPSVDFLQRVASREIDAALDAEVLQEILHRYRALGRCREGRQLYDLVRRLFPIVVPVTEEVLDRARQLLDEYGDLMARDALHAAVVEMHSFRALCSYDRDFDQVRTIRRVEPGAETR